MTPTWERILVRALPGGGFIGEGRWHAHFAVGAICKTPEAALQSASEAMQRELAKMRPYHPPEFEDDLL